MSCDAVVRLPLRNHWLRATCVSYTLGLLCIKVSAAITGRIVYCWNVASVAAQSQDGVVLVQVYIQILVVRRSLCVLPVLSYP